VLVHPSPPTHNTLHLSLSLSISLGQYKQINQKKKPHTTVEIKKKILKKAYKTSTQTNKKPQTTKQ
jgi:hypothetical protein